MRLIRQETAQIVLVVFFIDLAECSVYSTIKCKDIGTLGLGLAHLSSRLVWSVEVFWTYRFVTDAGNVILVGGFVKQISESDLLIACITQIEIS